MFPDPDFLYSAGISVIREHVRQISRFSFLHGFSGPLGQKWGVVGGNRGEIGEEVRRYWPPTNSFLLLGVYTSVSNLVKIDEEIRPWECPQTNRHTLAQTQNDFIICPSDLLPCCRWYNWWLIDRKRTSLLRWIIQTAQLYVPWIQNTSQWKKVGRNSAFDGAHSSNIVWSLILT